MLSKKKKIIIIATMVVLLAVTGFLNIRLNSSATQQTSTTTSANFFATYRSSRTETRDEEVLLLEAIINSSASTESEIATAKSKKDAILSNLNLEFAMESQILSKGFSDVVVSCSDNYINVMVKSAALEEYEVAQIVEIIQKETTKDIDNIKIIPVE